MDRHAIPDIELRAKLAERGLECHLLLPKDGSSVDFPSALSDVLKPLLQAAYERAITPGHLVYESWAVVLGPATGPPVACCTMAFTSDFPSYFTTHFEAVHPDAQRQGLGRLLFECVAVWARFLVFNDPLALEGVMQSGGDYCLVSIIDAPDQPEWEGTTDNQRGHGTFLRKLGFIRAQHDFQQNEDEIAFQRAFRVPVRPDELEEGPVPSC
jgi:GNAT superfamily N-acetyltransferase